MSLYQPRYCTARLRNPTFGLRALHTSGDIYIRCYEQGVDGLFCRPALDLSQGVETLGFLTFTTVVFGCIYLVWRLRGIKF